MFFFFESCIVMQENKRTIVRNKNRAEDECNFVKKREMQCKRSSVREIYAAANMYGY